MVTRDPLTRYWFIDQLARAGRLASIDEAGWITRPLRPHAEQPPLEALAQPRYHSDIRAVYRAGDQTHTWPQG